MGNAGLTFIQPYKFVKELRRPSEDLRGYFCNHQPVDRKKYTEFFF